MRTRSSPPLEPPLVMGDGAWALQGMILENDQRFPLLARLFNDAYEDTLFRPEEIPNLSAELDGFESVFKRLSPESRVELDVGLFVPVKELLDFCTRCERLPTALRPTGT